MEEQDKSVGEVKEILSESINMNKVEELIKSNITEFEYKGETYKTRLPSFKEKQKAYDMKVIKFTELLADEKYKLEIDLKKMYKKRGIDIDMMTAEFNTLETKKENLENQLGPLLKEGKSPEDCKELGKAIDEIKGEQYSISIKKTNFLQYSVESQVLIYVYRYLTYVVTEKKVEDKFVPAWSSYKDFENSSEELINKASFNASLLIGQI